MDSIQLAFFIAVKEIDYQAYNQPNGKADPVFQIDLRHHVQAADEAQHRNKLMFFTKTLHGQVNGDHGKKPHRNVMRQNHAVEQAIGIT